MSIKFEILVWKMLELYRQATRRAGTSVSYKEQSDEGTDSEDLVDVEDAAAETAEPDNAETIERIIAQRIGKKGGLCLELSN